jgi:hypothetical protein
LHVCLGKVMNVKFVWLYKVEYSWINVKAFEVVIEIKILNWMDVYML